MKTILALFCAMLVAAAPSAARADDDAAQPMGGKLVGVSWTCNFRWKGTPTSTYVMADPPGDLASAIKAFWAGVPVSVALNLSHGVPDSVSNYSLDHCEP